LCSAPRPRLFSIAKSKIDGRLTMGFYKRSKAKTHVPQDGDTLDSIAERETAAGNRLTWQNIARFNWGTDDPEVIDEFMRDQMGCYERGEDKRFVFSADIASEEPLLIPRPFQRSGHRLEAVHTLSVRRLAEPPDQFEACCKVSGPTFEFDKSFVRPSVVDDLEAVQAEVANHPDAKILIMGHTDKVGRKAYNKALSERRARSVRAFITNDVDTWVELADDPREQWGIREAQMILKDMGEDEPRYDPGKVDGINGPLTRAAVREFQTDNPPLAVDGQYGPNTRRVLYEKYMSGKHDIEIEADRFMNPPEEGFMGCGERNPLMRINDERDADGREADEADTEERCEENRRVTVFLFSEDRLPRLPCGIADTAPCEKRVTPPARLHNSTFTCSYYDSLARYCSCEGGRTTPVIVTVNPVLTVQQPVVLVRKPHTNPARQVVRLGTDTNFDGSGTLNRSSDAIRFFTAATGGTEITFDGADNVFEGVQLTSGIDVFAEGAHPSNAIDDVTFGLTLTPGSAPVGPEASATMTSVEVVLDICQSRTSSTTDPVPLSAEHKINTGRFVQVQDAGNHCGRAKLIVRQAEPAAFAGELEITSIDNKVQLFAEEVAASGQSPIALPHALANSAIPADGSAFWVQGAAVSGALRDTGFRLGVRNVEPDGDRVAVTAVNLTRIQATIRSTPPNTARPGIALPVDHVFRSTDIDQDFTANEPLVLLQNAQPDIALLVTVAPANLPLRWQAIRNPDDNATLGNAAAIPTVTPSAGNPDRAVLDADNKGSFRIRSYIDCNGNNQYSDGEPSIPLNLVLADVTVVADNSAGLNGNLISQGVNGGVTIRNGTWPATWAAATANGGAGMTMELVADVTGGGADGRLGLDRVLGGLVNNLTGNDIRLTYRDESGHAPVNYTIRNRYVTNRTDAGGNYGTTPMFQPGDAAPVLLTFPVLDTGRNPGGIGADTALMSRSGVWDPAPADRPVGSRYTLRCIDSPGRGFLRQHPDHANALLAQIHYVQRFSANFCFWTNVSAVRGQSGDPADRVYSVVRTMDWAAIGDWDVDSTNAVPVLNNTVAHTIAVTNPATISPIGRVQDHGIEVRPPSGITSAIAWETT